MDLELEQWYKVHNKLFDDIQADKLTFAEAKKRQDDLFKMSHGDSFINPYGLGMLMKEKYEGGEPYKPLFTNENPMTNKELEEEKEFLAYIRKIKNRS